MSHECDTHALHAYIETEGVLSPHGTIVGREFDHLVCCCDDTFSGDPSHPERLREIGAIAAFALHLDQPNK